VAQHDDLKLPLTTTTGEHAEEAAQEPVQPKTSARPQSEPARPRPPTRPSRPESNFFTPRVFLAACWGLVRKLNKWLVSVSVGAEIQLERTQGVSAAASRRFRRLVRLIGRPFAVLIDDLDRSDPTFAVELLEGIEQLWGEVPVVYLTAVDGSVLREAFLEAELARLALLPEIPLELPPGCATRGASTT